MDLLQTGHSHNEIEETKQIGEAILDVLKAARSVEVDARRDRSQVANCMLTQSLFFVRSPFSSKGGVRDRALLEQLNAALHQNSRKHVTYDRFKEALNDLTVEGVVRTDRTNNVRLV